MQLHHESSFPAPTPRGHTVRLLSLLGTGSNSSVFRADYFPAGSRPAHETCEQWQEAGADVAVKIPRDGVDLAHEASMLNRFAHPNVVRLVGNHTDDTHGELSGAIVVERCSDGTLEDRVMRQALTASEVHLLVSAIGSALSAIHKAGWIHGDVNPSNIGLRSTEPPCLFDFETARPINGTPASSDERATIEFSGAELPTAPISDVRSLAATALWALGTPEEFSMADRHVSDGLQRIIARCDTGQATIAEQSTPGAAEPLHLESSTDDDCSLDALLAVFDPVPRASGLTRPADYHSLVASSDHDDSNRPRTRTFGPRPNSPHPSGAAHDTEDDAYNEDTGAEALYPGRRLIAAAVCALGLLLLVGFGIVSSPAAEATEPPPSDAISESRVTAAASLDRNAVAWSVELGSAQLSVNGVAMTFTPGQRGDLAAVGDWDCDGLETLGVFRPSTGTWFAFTTWETDSLSTVEILTDPNPTSPELWVVTNAQGCDRPALT